MWIGEATDGRERLFVGEINPDWIEGRHGSVDRRIPATPQGALDLIEWIESGPDKLNRVLDAELPDALGDPVDVMEWYPPTPEELEEIGR